MDCSASDVLYHRLKEKIQSGTFELGEKVPTEQTLCKEYHVGRSTVREALRILQARGYVEIRRGSGAYVTSISGENSEGIQQWLTENKDNISDYMRVREALETLAVRLIIENRASIGLLEKISSELESAVINGDIDMMATMDESFHKSLARISRNVPLININASLQDDFKKYRYLTFENVENRVDAVNAHRRIIEAINRRDTDDAVFQIKDHLRTSLKNAISGLSD